MSSVVLYARASKVGQALAEGPISFLSLACTCAVLGSGVGGWPVCAGPDRGREKSQRSIGRESGDESTRSRTGEKSDESRSRRL